MKRRISKQNAPFFEELEPRLLFSADVAEVLAVDAVSQEYEEDAVIVAEPDNEVEAVVDVDEPVDGAVGDDGVALEESANNLGVIETSGDSAAEESATVAAEDNAASETNADDERTEIVFVNDNVQDFEQLLEGIEAGDDNGRSLQIVVLDGEESGVEQVTSVLSTYSDVDAIHILSHGNDGFFLLGSDEISNDTLAGYSDQISSWSSALTEDADILLYGCNIAADENGLLLTESLAALTGADVAASDDATGAADLGADWDLEVHDGAIETGIVISDETQNSWEGVLTSTDLTTSWTISAATNGTATSTTTAVDAVSVDVSFSTPGDTVVQNIVENNLTSSAFFSDSYVEGASSLSMELLWDTTNEASTAQASDDAGTITVTFTFDSAVVDPILHIDRLGGSGDTTSNSSLWTLITEHASLVKLAGVDHLEVNDTTFYRTPNVTTALSVSEASANSADGTAAGSIQILGTFTSLTFEVTGTGVEGKGGDGVEIAWEIPNHVPTDIVYEDDTYAVAIDNPSFEFPDLLETYSTFIRESVDSWTISSDSGHNVGTYVVGADAPDGTQTAYIDKNVNGEISQTLTETFKPGTDYTLSVWVGDSSTTSAASWEIALYAGTEKLGFVDSSGYPLNSGVLEEVILSLPSGVLESYSDFYGESLKIVLSNTDTAINAHFDNVSLTASRSASVLENAADGTVVNSVQRVEDGDDDTFTYSMVDDAGGRFEIDSSSGQISVADSSLIDYEQATSHTITVGVTDPGGAYYQEDMVIAVIDSSVNNLVNTVPNIQTTDEDTNLVFNSVNGNQISVDGEPDQVLNVTLSVTNGSLTLAGVAGLAFTAGDGSDDASMTFTGSVTDINTALNGLVYAPASDFNGTATLSLSSEDATYASVTLNSSLAGYYSFDTSLTKDDSASGNDAVVATGTSYSDQVLGNVMSLDGSQYVQIDTLYGEPADVTLAAWVNLATADASGAEVISLGDNIVLRLDDTNGSFLTGSWYDGSTWQKIEYNITLEDTGWHHVAFTLGDADTAVLYLDGVAVTTLSGIGSISYTTGGTSTFIGTHGNGLTGFDFTGYIDDARIYTSVLTSSEIEALSLAVPTATDSVTITVNPVNDAPVAKDYAFNSLEDLVISDDVTSTSSDVDGDVLFLSQVNGTAVSIGDTIAVDGGSLHINADGTVTFTPTENLTGTFSSTFTISDGNGGSDSAIISATLYPVNDAPEGADKTIDLAEDTTYTFTLADFGITDVEGDSLHAVWFTSLPTEGALKWDGSTFSAGNYVVAQDIADGKLTYTPSTDYIGTTGASFTFTVQDDGGTANGGSDMDPTANTISFNVTAVNDAPVMTQVYSPEYPTTEDAAVYPASVTSLITANALTDVDSADLGIAVTGMSGSGGTIEYSLDGGSTWQAFVSLSDSNALLLDADDLMRYVPDGENGGTLLLDYRAWDKSDGETAGTYVDASTVGGATAFSAVGDRVTVTIADVNDAPVLHTTKPLINIQEDDFTSNGMLVADYAALSTDVDNGAVNGIAVVGIDETNGTWQYTTDGTNWVDIGAVSTTNALLLAGDATSRFRFVPDADYYGISGLFKIKAWDQTSGTAETYVDVTSAGGATPFSAGTVSLSLYVTPVQDAPVASDDFESGSEDATITGNVLDNDTDADGDNLSVSLVSGTSSGTIVLNGDGSFVYTPLADFAGSDSFTYEVSDGNGNTDQATVSLTVAAVNDGPVFLGTTLASNGTFNVDPTTDWTLSGNVDWNGSEIRFGQIGGANGTLSQTITTAVGEPYIVKFDYYDASSTVAQSLLVKATGSATLFSEEVVSSTTNNTATSYSYSFVADSTSTTISFTDTSATHSGVRGYLDNIIVAQTTSSAATVDFIENSGAVSVYPDVEIADIDNTILASVTVQIIGNYVSTEDILSFVDTTEITGSWDSASGTLTLSGSAKLNLYQDAVRSISYSNTSDTPDSGDRTISLIVNDGSAASAALTTTITVTPFNDAPVATDDSYSVNEDGSLTGLNVLTNDSDAEGDPLGVTLITDTSNGSLTLHSDGSFSYTPNGDYYGTDSFVYEVSDGNGGTAQATATITVVSVNDAPVISSSNAFSVDENSSVIGTVVASDVDSATLSYNMIGGPDQSRFSLNTTTGELSFSFLPDYENPTDGDLNNVYVVTVQVSDGVGGLANQTISVTVGDLNDNTPVIAAGQIFTISEFATAADVAGTVVVTDSDNSTTYQNWTITAGNDGGVFTIDGSTGEISVLDASQLDYETTSAYTLSLTVSDGTNTSSVETVTIDVINENDTPTSTTISDITVDEDSAATVIDLFASFADAEDADSALIYTIAGNDNPSLFSSTAIDGSAGTLTLNYATNQHGNAHLTVRATDSGGEYVDASFVVTVNSVADLSVGSEALAVDEDTLVSGDVAANDTTTSGGVLTYSLDADVASGSLVFNSDGTFEYTPDAEFNGTDSFDYTVTDASSGESSSATATITVNPVNDAPVAVNDSVVVAEGSTTTLDLGGNDSDVDDGLDLNSLSIVSGPSNGSLVVNSDGTVEYTHDGSETVSDSFTYTISDASGAISNTATVNLSVIPLNDAPVVSTVDLGIMDEDASLTISQADLLFGATDAEGNALSASGLAISSGSGVVTDNHDGTWSFMPVADWNGPVVFSFSVTDGTATVTNSATLTVNPVNDDPVAGDIMVSTAEETPLSGHLTVASDIDGDTVTYSLDTDAGHGSALVASDGSFTYTPDINFNGSDSFTYTVKDGNGGSNTYIVDVSVAPVNDAPIVVDDAFPVFEGSTTVLDLMGNDSDVDDGLDPASITIVSGPANGAVTVNSDGTVDYVHDGSETTSDSFTYTIRDLSGATSNLATVTLFVAEVNDAPVAVDDSVIVAEGATVTLNLAANDYDVDDGLDLSSIVISSGPVNGTISVHSDGTVTYTHDGSETNSDSFIYTIRDYTGASSLTAVVDIAISSVNDEPVVSTIDLGAVNEDTNILISQTDLLAGASDAEGDALTAANLSLTSGSGSLTDNLDGSWNFSPAADWNGSVSFAFDVTDGTATVANTASLTVAAVNDAPTAGDTTVNATEDSPFSGHLTVASDVEGDAVTYALETGAANGTVIVQGDGSFTYTPVANFGGSDSFTYSVSDTAGGTSTYTAHITVTPVNDLPVAGSDSFTVLEGSTRVLNLAANDTDVENRLDLTSIRIVTPAANGSITVNNDGTVNYSHNGGETAADSFTYTIDDLDGGVSTPVTVSLTVLPVNDAPIAGDDSYTVSEGSHLTMDLAANDTDAENGLDLSTLTIISGPVNGTVVVNGDGTVSYTHNGSETTSDSFTYTISDGLGASSNTATVDITIVPVNDSPVVAAVSLGNVDEDMSFTFSETDLLAGATDADGDPMSIRNLVLSSGNGTLVDNQDGSWTFAPFADWNGSAGLSFDVTDGTTTVANSASLVVNAVNDAPTASDDSLTGGPRSTITGSVTANDSDVESDPLVVNLVRDVSHGSLVLRADGTFSYTPDSGFSGEDSFTYRVNDGEYDSGIATVSLTVSVPADAAEGDSAKTDPGGTSDNNETVVINRGSGTGEILIDEEKHRQEEAEQGQDDSPLAGEEDIFTEGIAAVDGLGEVVIPMVTFDLQDNVATIQANTLARGDSSGEIHGDETQEVHEHHRSGGLANPWFVSKSYRDLLLKNDYVVSGSIHENLALSTVMTATHDAFEASEPFSMDPAMHSELKKMFEDMSQNYTSEMENHRLQFYTVGSVAATLTVGIAGYLLKGGSLMSSFLATVPLWKSFDPVPVLSARKDKKKKDNDQEPPKDPGIDRMFAEEE